MTCEQAAMLVQISPAAGQILLDLEPLEAEPGRETDPEHLHPQWGLMLEECRGSAPTRMQPMSLPRPVSSSRRGRRWAFVTDVSATWGHSLSQM